MIKKNKYLQFLNRDGRNSQGLTLLEILIAVALIVILTAVSIPVIGSAMQNSRVRAAALKIALDLRLARATAVQQNAPFFLAFNAALNNYALTCGSAANACLNGAGAPLGPPWPAPAAMVLTDAPGGVVALGALFPGVTLTVAAGPACVGFSAGQGAMVSCPAFPPVAQSIIALANGAGTTRNVVVAPPTGSTKVCNPCSPPCP